LVLRKTEYLTPCAGSLNLLQSRANSLNPLDWDN